MPLFRLRNWADLDEAGGPAELANVVVPLPPVGTLQLVERAVANLRGWRVEQADLETLKAHLTRTTRLFRFVDDIYLRLEIVAGGTRLHAHSQSRMGAYDFGQNRRNLLELIRALRAAVPPAE